MSFWGATIPSSLLGLSYVLSLYIWRSGRDRDHPSTIKRRFVSAFFMTLLAPLFVAKFGAQNLLDQHDLATMIGIRRSGLLAAILAPLFLTMSLFLGPLVSTFTDERSRIYTIPAYWAHSLRDWIWWRNHVVAPFTEEFTFRACMLPILLGYYSPGGAVMISPLFFGFAHFHHMYERIRKGQDFRTAFLISAFQFAYTTVFGMYSAFLFLRTGHLVAPVLVHGFCNFMGFPDLSDVWNQKPLKRYILSFLFVLGVVAFYSLLSPLTDPSLFQNNTYAW